MGTSIFEDLARTANVAPLELAPIDRDFVVARDTWARSRGAEHDGGAIAQWRITVRTAIIL